MIKTAVLMATYNGENFIIDQLESIKNQEMKPDYVIFRDDKSTDKTVEKIRSFIEENSLENWIINQNDNNLGWRLNFRALLLDVLNLDVDYVFFSDQDDTWYLNKNKIQVDIMETNKNIDLLSADIDIVKISEHATIPNQFQFDDSDQYISQYPHNINYINYRQGWTFCIRKSFVDFLTPYWNDNLILSHDNLFAGVSGILGTGYNYNHPVGVHKRHAGNASGNALKISDTREKHIYELKIFLSYYVILSEALNKLDNNDMELANKYRNFYEKRVENAQNRKFLSTVKQIINDKKFYLNFTNWVRDLLFLFKR
ncbi:glycosyl transferase family 2 [Floricoccus penangensis]|uniref:Glycosyl transferase family 2 n=1 Tax=Floricoccus penangensis TaxID=1859475 RepID=A0A9Q5P0M9_9LACT|nr:glycosyltransferase [Floricoccus penangensis]OFI47926.1 glycosyl transferase family 2 [Floricoccus penangensis]